MKQYLINGKIHIMLSSSDISELIKEKYFTAESIGDCEVNVEGKAEIIIPLSKEPGN